MLTSSILALWAASIGTTPSVKSYRFRLIDNLIFLPAEVERHAGWGVLDTGTSGVAIDQGFARKAGVPKGRLLGKADVSGARPINTWQTALRELRMPDTVLKRMSAVILDMSAYSQSSGSPVEVLVGLPFFRHRIVSIDYPNRMLTIAPSTADGLQCAAPVPFQLIDGTPVVEASASLAGGQGHQRLRLMVDLGTRHQAMLLGGSFLATPAGSKLKKSAPRTQVTSGAGGPVYGWSGTAKSLMIGTRIYRHITFAASSQLNSSEHPPYDGTLGVPFWKTGAIKFDYDRGLLCFPDQDGTHGPL